MLETALVVAFIAVGITAVSSVIDFIQTWHIRKVQNKLDEVSALWQGKGDIGDQFGKWLLFRESTEKPSNLQVCAIEVGSQIASSIRGSVMGSASGEARHLKGIEAKVMDLMEPDAPEMKLAKSILERIGLPIEELPYVIQTLQKYGHMNPQGFQGNNGSKSKNVFGIE